jgi:hypothetical protein
MSSGGAYGHAKRGTGILNNGLYVGRMVWNRYVKNPDTGKRVPRLNPQSEWITADAPHLRTLFADALTCRPYRASPASHESTPFVQLAAIARHSVTIQRRAVPEIDGVQ